MRNILPAIVLLSLTLGASCQDLRKVKVSVAGDDGNPIKDAKVTIGFLGSLPHQTEKKIGLTTQNGVFEASGTAMLRMGVLVEKDGYYLTQSERLSREENHDLHCKIRKMENPIPLFARKFSGRIPNLKQPHGFDFKKGDWVAPHGKGEIADIFFTVHVVEQEKGGLIGRLGVTFSSSSEGVCKVDANSGYLSGSDLKMPNKAPLGGYVPKMEREIKGGQYETQERNIGWFVRSRFVSMPDGEAQHNYAKLTRDVNVFVGGGRFLPEDQRREQPQEYAVITFVYCFNPEPNDRNLEFDSTRNLLEGLDAADRVLAP